MQFFIAFFFKLISFLWTSVSNDHCFTLRNFILFMDLFMNFPSYIVEI